MEQQTGHPNKISKVDVLGALCKIGGLIMKEVGRIDVREHQSFAAIHREKKCLKSSPDSRGRRLKALRRSSWRRSD